MAKLRRHAKVEARNFPDKVVGDIFSGNYGLHDDVLRGTQSVSEYFELDEIAV